MTKVIFHGSVKALRGRIGGLIFKQLPDGTTVVTQAPSKKNSREKKRAWEKRSKEQKAHNNRFGRASAYAKVAQVDPVYVKLAAVTPMWTAYNFALSDWSHAPEIQRIEQKKGRIRVQATDNVMVARVSVTVLDSQGKIAEAGEATRKRGNWWEYTPQTTGKTIRAEAWDLPGNVVRQDVLSKP
jgi:hypothetical protein